MFALTRPFGDGVLASNDGQFTPLVDVPIHDVAGGLISDVVGDPMLVVDPLAESSDAALGYLLAAATSDGDRWSLDLSGHLVASDQVALALLEHDVVFARSGDDGGILSGPGSIPSWSPTDPSRVIAGSWYLGGNRAGRLSIDDVTGGLATVAAEAGVTIEYRTIERRSELWVVGRSSLVSLASMAYLCDTDVALLGTHPCSGDQTPTPDAEQTWTAATTGPLQIGAPEFPATEDGGVGWTNREAQSYRPDLVRFSGEAIELIAVANQSPSTLSLPFASGMVIGQEELGYGRIDVTARLPIGDGLWPAIWLLDAAACEAPGRCSAYESTNYHEIDILETNGARPNEAHTSVHWFDERVQSETAITELASLADGLPHVYSLIRRPGMLIWLIDDVEVFRVTGEANARLGPHRADPMYLVINLAVGGTFAGDRILGPNSPWWGDAKAPASFPDVGWDEATLGVDAVSFTPLVSLLTD